MSAVLFVSGLCVEGYYPHGYWKKGKNTTDKDKANIQRPHKYYDFRFELYYTIFLFRFFLFSS